MPRTKLSNLVIDEISVVDRMANQHSNVVIAKRDEDSMTVYDAEGVEVFEDEFEHGETYYDEAGTELQFLADGSDELAELQAMAADEDRYDEDGIDHFQGVEDELEEEDEGVLVGKAGWGGSLRRAGSRAVDAGRTGGRRARFEASVAPARAVNAGRAVGRNRGKVSGAGGTALGVYGGRKSVRKSYGDEVLQELSKALSDGDRNAVIAKALDRVEQVERENDDLSTVVKSLVDERELEQFGQLADEYGLPVSSEELAPILHRVAKSLPRAQFNTLDRVLKSVGQQLYDTIGSDGSGQISDVMAEVEAIANSAVSKGDTDLSPEQAIVAVFESNPAAYDNYLAELG